MTVPLSTAIAIIDAALRNARTRGVAPLAVAVVDAGAHLIAMHREDGASLMRPEIAIATARGAIGMGFGTRGLARRAGVAPAFFQGLMAMSGNILPSPGGVLLRDERGALVGAVGVSGDTGDIDEACALAGIAATHLTADPGE